MRGLCQQSYKGLAALGIGGMETYPLERRHCFTPRLGIFSGLQNEIDVVGAAGFAGAGRIVGGNQDLGECLERFEVVWREETGAIVTQKLGVARRHVAMLMILSSKQSRQGSKLDKVTARGLHDL